ncbi:MAG: hypothetical protein MJ061_05570 [Mailhella sp.]|nr:hypothetical protein [Mailhella sp.]
MSSYQTGQIIEARCTRCRDVTGHNIMACVDGVPVKVECRACGSVHKYAAPVQRAPERREKAVRIKAGSDRGTAVEAAVKRSAAAEQVRAAAAPKPVSKSEQKAVMKAEQAEKDWKAVVDRIAAEPVPYAMDASFSLGTLVMHPVFGLGAVVELLPPDKMDVLFREGPKRLRCALEK